MHPYQRQARFRDRRAPDVTAQPFQLVALMGFGRDAGMQRKPGNLTHRVVERLFAGRLSKKVVYAAHPRKDVQVLLFIRLSPQLRRQPSEKSCRTPFIQVEVV